MATPKITDLSSSMAAVGTYQTQADALVDVASIINTVYDSTNGLIKTSATVTTGDINVDNTSLDTSGLIGKNSGGDFAVTYASSTTLTIGALSDESALTADDIIAVQHITSAGAVTATHTRDDKTMAISAGVLTVTGAAFASGDSFVIYTNIDRRDVVPLLFTNRGAAASAAVKTSAGRVQSFTCRNKNAVTDFYFQLFNSASAPSAAAVPSYSFMIPNDQQLVIGTDFFTDSGISFSTGIAWGWSTTEDTFTAATATDQTTHILYR